MTMKTVITILIISISNILVYGQGNGLYKFIGDDGKYGFIDKTGKIIIEPKFLKVNDFSEGLAFVSEKVINKGYKWFCIDTLGNKIFDIGDNYPETDFSFGFARMSNFSEHWFINKEGKNEFGKTWKDGYLEFRNGIAYVSDIKFSNFFPIDTNGNRIGTHTFSRVEIYNKIKKEEKEEKEEKEDISSEPELTSFQSDSLYGFKNRFGDVIIQPQFYRVGKFENGICPVRTKNLQYEFIGGYYNAIIDTKGKILNEVEMYCYMGFKGELIEYYLGPHFSGGPHYLDKNGQKVKPKQ